MRAQNTMPVVLIAASCLLLGQTKSTNAQTPDKNAAAATIQELKEERVQTMRRAVEVLELQYREGVADFSRVGRAESALLEALIEVARSREEQIELLTQHCKLLEGTVLVAETKFEQGAANELDLLKARLICSGRRSDSCKLRLCLKSRPATEAVRSEPTQTPHKCRDLLIWRQTA